MIAVPSHVFRSVVRAMAPHLAPGARVLSAAKGIEEDRLARMSEVLAEELPPGARRPRGGAVRADLRAGGRPGAAHRGRPRLSDPGLARALQTALATPTFRLYTQADVTGVELGGALKNVMAIATGIADGLELGYNARAALLTRGLAEMTRLGVALGARRPDVRGTRGPGRPDPDLHGGAVAEPPPRPRAGARAVARRVASGHALGGRRGAHRSRGARPRPACRRGDAGDRGGRGGALRAKGAAGGAPRAPVALRPPEEEPYDLAGGTMPELRKDPVVERWVIIATERARRPTDFAPEVIAPRGPDGCPFCPGHEDRTPPEVFRSGGSEDGPWTVRVVPNKFPALHSRWRGPRDRARGSTTRSTG